MELFGIDLRLLALVLYVVLVLFCYHLLKGTRGFSRGFVIVLCLLWPVVFTWLLWTHWDLWRARWKAQKDTPPQG